MDVVAKAEALAQRALQRSAVEKQAVADKRAETWARIQNTDPTLAKFMTDLNRVFGKPAAIKVELDGETVIDQGTFAELRRFFDGKLRQLPEAKAWRR